MATPTLKGKTLFITGASRGIGLAIGLRAARDGANVAIAAKTAEINPKLPGTIYTAAKEIEEAGGNALPVTVDVRRAYRLLDPSVDDARRTSLYRTLRVPRRDLNLPAAVAFRPPKGGGDRRPPRKMARRR